MRWFRRGAGERQAPDPGRLAAVLHETRQPFGGSFAEQAATVQRLLDGDDGLLVAAQIVREFADAAHADLMGQVGDLNARTGHGLAVDRRNYRPLWQTAGPYLRWSLFGLRCGFHPYVQVAAAATVLGARAKRVVRVAEPVGLLSDLLEVLDLVIAGWEFARVPVDADGAALADRLITTTRALHDAMDEPPPLPPPVRELMRRRLNLHVYEPAGGRVVGTFDPGRRMREVLLT